MIFVDSLLYWIRECISLLGVVVIAYGGVRSLHQIFMLIFYDKFDTNYIRLKFGDTVVLGLEFMVGADIVGSLIAPDYYNLGLLGILVIIRTVLSYFLNLELQQLSLKQREEALNKA